jgi:Zn-dependent peptidase ImmA (M78 family)
MARRSAAPQSDVPFLHEKQIEQEADVLLAQYAEIIAPVLEPPVPIEEMAGTVLQLRHQFLDLRSRFPFADVHGAIWFEEAVIGIDSCLNPDLHPRRRGRYHFTLAHEIGHWRLHRQHYLKNPAERRLFDDGTRKPDVVCRSSERKKPVEWQADTFAAFVLMPRKLIHAAWAAFRGGDDRPVELKELHAASSGSTFLYRGRPASTEEERDNAIKEDFCRPLAEQFEVSREAMRIRLEGLDLIVRNRTATLF